ncbi:MAG: hypothetical protein KDB01_08160 [Planctomycetaceae bacterium]|nr:hypothetical protein [Planctomycetaceae bacterium]
MPNSSLTSLPQNDGVLAAICRYVRIVTGRNDAELDAGRSPSAHRQPQQPGQMRVNMRWARATDPAETKNLLRHDNCLRPTRGDPDLRNGLAAVWVPDMALDSGLQG